MKRYESKPTPEMIKDRKAMIDELISSGGFNKDFWIDNDLPAYYDAETMNFTEWEELIEYTQNILRRGI